MKNNKFRLAVVAMLTLAALIVIGACVSKSPEPAVIDSQAARPVEIFKSITVQNESDLRGTLNVDKAATFNSTVTATGDVTLNDSVVVGAQTAISVTNDATITPTGSYQPLTSAGTVTASLATSGYTTGTLLTLLNTANTTIVFTDTGTLKASGNVSLGQYDAASFIFDGTNWIQISESDN